MSEREETPAEEFSRLVIEYNEGERQNRAEAWNLIADFALEHCDTILRALRAPSPSPAPGVVTDEMVETAARAYAERQRGKGCPVWEEELPPIRAALASLSQPAKGGREGERV